MGVHASTCQGRLHRIVHREHQAYLCAPYQIDQAHATTVIRYLKCIEVTKIYYHPEEWVMFKSLSQSVSQKSLFFIFLEFFNFLEI